MPKRFPTSWIIVILATALPCAADAQPPIVDTATAIELNTTINGTGEELFTQILIWEGKELRYVHFWGECDEGTPFGFVVSDKPGEVEVYLRSLTGPRIVTAPKLIRSRTREPVELTHARNSPKGRQRRGLTARE